MKKCNKLILLGTILTTILFGQIPEIPQVFMNQNDSLYLPIFLNNATGLHSATIEVQYDSNVVVIDGIIEDPDNSLGNGFSFNLNYSVTGEILLSIWTSTSASFTGSGMIAEIKLSATGKAGTYSEFRFIDATINSIQRKDMAIHGSVDILLSKNELIITVQDASGIGGDDEITLGMCETCTDGWKYGEDEYNIDPTLTDTIKVTDIYFFQSEWFGDVDENENTCNRMRFVSDNRSQSQLNEEVIWGISGKANNIPSDIPISKLEF